VTPAQQRELASLVGRYRTLAKPVGEWVQMLEPSFIYPRHLQALLDVLTRCETEPVRALCSVPPRHGKTISLLAGAVHFIARNPGKTVLYASHSQHLADSKSRIARNYAIRAGVDLDPASKSVREWRTKQGGGMIACGVGAGLTGQGVDLAIVDDIHADREDAQSAVVGAVVWEWFTGVLLTRGQPGSSVIVNGTRWAPNDLIGRIQGEQGDRWEVINFPAVDDDGNALWPEIWPVELLMHRRAEVGIFDWNALFLGRPVPKGAKLFREPVRYDKLDLTGRKVVIGCDTAITAKARADYTVATVLSTSGYGSEATGDVIDVIRGQWEIDEVCSRLEQLQKRHNAPLVIEDAGPSGRAVIQLLKKANKALRIHPYTPVGDKLVRSSPAALAWNEGRLRAPAQAPWLADWLPEILAFTGVADHHDDCVDSLAIAWSHAQSTAIRPISLERGAYATGAPPPTDEWGRPIRTK
jgi:predicted phage terminase large subunit-like protein